jgi:hypothetical protein
MRDRDLVFGWSVVLGALLIGFGVLGFVNNPLVGPPATNPVAVTGTIHDMVHLATGAIALYIAFGLRGRGQANALIGLGVVYLVFLVLTILSPNLFGILNYPVNGVDHLIHAAIGVITIAIGYLGRARKVAVAA